MTMLDQMLKRLSGVEKSASSMDASVPPIPVAINPALAPVPRPVKVPKRQQHVNAGTYLSDPAEPLVSFSPHDHWTIEDACSGTHIWGGNGSGKTSGSGQTLAKAFLRAGFGGLVLVAKPDERERWVRYAKECGRSKHLIIVSEDGPWRFNFITYELKRGGDPAGRVEQLVTTLMNLVEQSGRKSGGDEAFWTQAAEQLLRNCLMVLAAARSEFSLLDVQKFIDSIPRGASREGAAVAGAGDMATWLKDARLAYEAANRLPDFDAIEHYLTVTFPGLADRTRSSVTFTLSAMIQDLLLGTLRELFSTGTNFVPEDTFEGAIIILDLPAVLRRNHATAQTLFKVVWQAAALRRMENITKSTRPVFVWGDESHFFLSEMDGRFLSLARAARVATVFLTQNISAYKAKLGTQNAGDLTQWIAGLFQTHLFHANSDPATIEHAQRLYGKQATTRWNTNWSDTVGGSYSYSQGQSSSSGYSVGTGGNSGGSWTGNFGHNAGESRGHSQSTTHGGSTSTSVEHVLEASDFTALASGSDQAPRQLRGISQAYVFRLGRVWSTGSTHLLAHFDRRLP